MSGLKLTLPVPPPVNTYYRNFRGRMVMSAKGREFKKLVAEYIAENQYRKFWDARLHVLLIFHPINKRKTDLDGRLKAVLDALEDAGVYNDDEQVDQLTIIRGNVVRGGKVVVYIDEIKAGYGDAEKISDLRPARDQDGSELTGSSRCAGCEQDCSKGHRDQSIKEVKA